MRLLYFGYSVLIGLGLLLALPFGLVYIRIKKKHNDHLAERLGWIPSATLGKLKGKPRLWFHAVSLGEVKAADAVIADLKNRLPGCAVIVSTSTRHGRDLAQSLFGPDTPVIYSPLDMIFCVRKALQSIRPDALIFIETEIWPSWVFEARRMGIRIGLVNGRISPRSLHSYLRLKPFIAPVLACFDAFSMIRDEDRERITAMGAPPERVAVGGNAKYDKIHDGVSAGMAPRMRESLGLPDHAPVLVAGSTRDGEEEMLADALERVRRDFPDIHLVIAPRHIKRSPVIGAMLARRGLAFRFRTEPAGEKSNSGSQILILDTFGELFNTYAAADVVFCGASLVPLGGQNPLEPAVWGKPVLYGPSMEDFTDAREMLEAAGGGAAVGNSLELAAEITRLLNDPQTRRAMGESAAAAVLAHQGAAEKHAQCIVDMLVLEGRKGDGLRSVPENRF